MTTIRVDLLGQVYGSMAELPNTGTGFHGHLAGSRAIERLVASGLLFMGGATLADARGRFVV